MNKNWTFLLLLQATLVVAGCSSSPLGPDIAKKEPTTESGTDSGTDGGTGISTGGQPNSGGTGDTGGSSDGSDTGGGSDDGSGDTADTSVACSQSSGHDVWYYGSAVSLVYTCGATVTSVATTDLPDYLTVANSGTSVTVSGTAPTTASTVNWSFAVNGETTTGDAADITTQIINPTNISLALNNSPNVSGNRATDIDLEHTATLHSSWDGSMSDVEMVTNAITHDIHGIQLYTNCSSATEPYVCDGSATTSSKIYNASTDFHWAYSAFDQGTYYLTLTPEITIEGGTTTLADQTATFTIPIQANGKVSVSYAGDVSDATFRDVSYNYEVGVSAKSTSANPLVGLVYFAGNGSQADTQFKRLSIDRTDDPTGGGSGVTESSNLKVSGGNISYSAALRSLTHSNTDYDGDWFLLGVRLDGTGENVYAARIPDGETPASEDVVDLTNFNSTTNATKYIDMTEIFDDSGTPRIGAAYVRYDGTNDFLTVIKVNPTGTNKAEYIDDSRYDPDPAGDQFEISAGNAKLDRVKIRYIDESGGMFYVAYRHTEALHVTKLATQWDGVDLYDETTTSAPFAGVFNDVDGSDLQALDLAVGSTGGSTVVGLTYRDKNGDCFFRKLNQALDTAGSAVQLNSETCYFPSIHWIAKSGKFVVTWGETNTSNGSNREIYMSEITLGSPDTATSALLVADTGFAFDFQALDTAYNATGDWMSVFYHIKFLNSIHIHGYHVPGR